MNEPLKQSLLTACAFADQFIKAADTEIRGGSPARRREALAQLQYGLELVGDEAPCQCAHNLFWHEGLTGGMCLKSGCHCMAYKEVAA
jgi:hypothetical protein